MKVEQLMKRPVKTCTPLDALNTAAQIMWDYDCGCVPVVEGNQVVGMLTDRDICMAAYIQGSRLRAMDVWSAMSKEVYSCKPDDTMATAEAIMREKQVRRLPVIDAAGDLVGILSLNDVVREVACERLSKGRREVTGEEVSLTLGAICEPRDSTSLVTAV